MENARSTDEAGWPVFRALQGVTAAGAGRDLAAGLTLAAIAIPEQMATARLGGFAPQIGLFAFVAATFAFAAFGSSRQLSAGADSTITPIFAGSLAGMAVVGSAHYAELAAALALMVGLIVALAGVFRLGWIADLLSRPVTAGFLAGISIHIVISQAPAALGLPEGSGDVYHRLAAIWREAGSFSPAALAIALSVLAVTLAAEKLNPRIPGALIALAGATIATASLGLAARGVAVLGAARAGLPSLQLPDLSFETALPLVGLAFVVALVVMVQTAATTRSFAGEDGDPDVDRDFIGLGVGNALAGLFGAMPVDASPPRTAVAAAAGGRTQIGGLAAAALVLALAIFGAGLMAQTPAAALAGVLLFVALRIFRFGDFAQLLKRTPAEFSLAVATTVMIFALPIQTGVAIGVFLSLAHGVFTITQARLIPFERAPGTTIWWPASPERHGERLADVVVMGFQAPLSFLNAYAFRRNVREAVLAAAGKTRLFVLEASSIVEIDFTAAGLLGEVIEKARANGIDFAIARLESVRAQDALTRFGVMETLGQDHVFRSVEEAIRTLAPQDAAT